MEKYSEEWWLAVSCQPGCANCCPKKCIHLTTSNLCDVHPSKYDGTNITAWDHGRGLECHVLPIQLFLGRVFCPAIAREVDPSIVIRHHSDISTGIEVIDNLSEILSITRIFRSLKKYNPNIK